MRNSTWIGRAARLVILRAHGDSFQKYVSSTGLKPRCEWHGRKPRDHGQIFDQATNAVGAVYISLLNYISQIVLP